MCSTEFAWLSDEVLVRWLTVMDRRPNLLIVARDAPAGLVADRLTTLCQRPITTSVLPGRLDLPSGGGGTLVLQNVSALNLAQQIALNDWIGDGPGRPQIVSIATTDLWELVMNGDFLEGLFYRLNVMCLDATRQPLPPDSRLAGRLTGLAKSLKQC